MSSFDDAYRLRSTNSISNSVSRLTMTGSPLSTARRSNAAELTFEDEPSIEEAIHLWKGSSTDFADCLINARNRRLGCRTTATFDRKALQLTGFSQV